ncbi:MAG: hypothetical protein AB1578_00055 [Thermodesulfobacteriota bacterium]
MNATSRFLLAAMVAAFLPFTAIGEEKKIEGNVLGYNCVVNNIGCPADMEDPVVANERIFVVSISDKEFVFVPNIDRAVLARYITKTVRVSGDFNEKYNAIQANTLEVKTAGTWKTVWTLAWEEEFRAKFNIPRGQ